MEKECIHKQQSWEGFAAKWCTAINQVTCQGIYSAPSRKKECCLDSVMQKPATTACDVSFWIHLLINWTQKPTSMLNSFLNTFNAKTCYHGMWNFILNMFINAKSCYHGMWNFILNELCVNAKICYDGILHALSWCLDFNILLTQGDLKNMYHKCWHHNRTCDIYTHTLSLPPQPWHNNPGWKTKLLSLSLSPPSHHLSFFLSLSLCLMHLTSISCWSQAYSYCQATHQWWQKTQHKVLPIENWDVGSTAWDGFTVPFPQHPKDRIPTPTPAPYSPNQGAPPLMLRTPTVDATTKKH